MTLKITREEVEEVLDKARQLLTAGAFSISQREKNNMFMDEYNLTHNKVKQLVLDLKVEDFHAAEYNNNENYDPDNICYIFVPQVLLSDVMGERKKRNVYVKFVIVMRKISDTMILISLHEAEHGVNYPFR